MNDLVSVITPCYNSDKFLERTIDSVLNQSYTNFELLIIDDFSTDNSRKIIQEKSKKDTRIVKIFNSENHGTAVSRNKGIESAKGRFIAFLDSDDYWYENKLKLQLNFMVERKLEFSFGPYIKVDEFGGKVGVVYPETIMTYSKLLDGNKIGCLTAIYDSKSLGKIYFPNIKKRQDWALWLKIHKKIKNSQSIDQFLGEYTVRKQSVSSNKFSLVYFHYLVYRKIEKLSIIKTFYFLLKYIFAILWRR
jgi:teichuronic acid biosynthesis glycosyltransferase TuaG